MDEVQLEIAKEIAKDVYADGGKPIVKPTGELIGLVPRAIKAAFLPLEKWIMGKEYNLKETQKLLELKLQTVDPNFIQPPEAHVAVPALQYISYCMDNEELRDMYANLLANSMNKVVKNGVHPGFVEIIKQLCPDEAKILQAISLNNDIAPTISLRYINDKGEGITIIEDFSDIGEKANCEQPLQIKNYFDNLKRLGIIHTKFLASLINNQLYETVINHPYILSKMEVPENYSNLGYNKTHVEKGYYKLSAYGKAFCSICLSSTLVLK